MAQSRKVRLAVLTAAILVVASGCSSQDDAESGGDASTSMTSSDTTFTGSPPEEITTPEAEGNGIVRPQPAAPLPEGYVEEELFIGGTATSFDEVDTPEDGTWTATPGEEAEYRTRVIVRRPADAEDFSGTVLVEWFNVSAIEAAPDWGYLTGEIGREGHAYIGVSAQAQGVEGGETILDVEVDAEAAGEAGATGSTDDSGLRNIDPERYGSLTHPGDAYSFDIFSQVGRAVTEAPDEILGGLEPQQVLALGESQSSMFLSTLINAIHPLDPVFDGFFVHSRGAPLPPLDGNYESATRAADPEVAMEQGTLIRTDLDVPVFILETETDLTLLGYSNVRQPDTAGVRTWEVAGTAHADAHTLRSILGGPRDPSIGSLIGCTEPINTGPHHEVAQAALHHLVDWAAGGDPPPEGQRIELVEGDELAIARDELGMAIGGVRNPLVDAPVAVVSGDPPEGTSIEDLLSGEGGICMLFGTTTPIPYTTLIELYGDADGYLEAFGASADREVEGGFLLRPDADALVTEAEGNTALFQ